MGSTVGPFQHEVIDGRDKTSHPEEKGNHGPHDRWIQVLGQDSIHSLDPTGAPRVLFLQLGRLDIKVGGIVLYRGWRGRGRGGRGGGRVFEEGGAFVVRCGVDVDG